MYIPYFSTMSIYVVCVFQASKEKRKMKLFSQTIFDRIIFGMEFASKYMYVECITFILQIFIFICCYFPFLNYTFCWHFFHFFFSSQFTTMLCDIRLIISRRNKNHGRKQINWIVYIRLNSGIARYSFVARLL